MLTLMRQALRVKYWFVIRRARIRILAESFPVRA
jgi:hypothetical protein